MQINAPCAISPRLLPGTRVADAWISIKRDGETDDGRDRFRVYIDAPGIAYESNDQASGVGGGELAEGLRAALSFLGACGESVNFRMRTGRQGESEDLFPPEVGEWAAKNSDALQLASLELEESPSAIEE